VTTPVELDPKNAVKPTPGKPAPAALPGGVYFCTDANFAGNCAYVSGMNSGQCVGVGSNFNDNVSSFGPDSGLTCTIYSDAGCKGRATGGVVYPGIYNLADYNNNDAMSSFSCTGNDRINASVEPIDSHPDRAHGVHAQSTHFIDFLRRQFARSPTYSQLATIDHLNSPPPEDSVEECNVQALGDGANDENEDEELNPTVGGGLSGDFGCTECRNVNQPVARVVNEGDVEGMEDVVLPVATPMVVRRSTRVAKRSEPLVGAKRQKP
ncbi:hypothetical protein FRC06_008048, partial [Ceratobasidium sp. 370]